MCKNYLTLLSMLILFKALLASSGTVRKVEVVVLTNHIRATYIQNFVYSFYLS